MAQDSTAIRVAANGHVYIAPVGTAAPADESVSMPTGWVELGYMDDTGVKFTDNKNEVEILSWQSFYATRRIITKREGSLDFVMQQWSGANVKLSFGGGSIAQSSGAGHWVYTPPDPSLMDYRAACIEWADGTTVYRIVVPKSVVTDAVTTVLDRKEAALLPIKLAVVGVSGQAPWTVLTNDPAWP